MKKQLVRTKTKRIPSNEEQSFYDPKQKKQKPDTSTFETSSSLPTKNAVDFSHSSHCAPTPHGPASMMPPTPSCVQRNSDDIPTPDSVPNRRAVDPNNEPTPPPTGSSYASGETTKSRSTPYSPSKNDKSSDSASSSTGLTNGTNKMHLKNNFNNWEVGARYRIVRLLGKGSYGQVVEAFDTVLEKRVAIKKIINVFEQEVDCKRLYREIYILRHLRHPEVITLLDVIPPADYDSFRDLYLVFEFVDTDLHKLISSPQYLTTRHIQVFLYQLLCGLKYIHSANVIHRDMKPANILLNEDCTLKICDFGLSRVVEENMSKEKKETEPISPAFSTQKQNENDFSNVPKFQRQLTKHVVTRWYRAPELILLQEYGYAVDMWSLGCIFAELLSMQVESCPQYQSRAPIFPGRSCFPLSADRPTTYSDKLDQLNVIFNVIGTPDENDIGNLGEVKQYLRKLPKKEPIQLNEMYRGASVQALDLLKRMLAFNPDNRISVEEALEHPFLSPVRRIRAEAVEQNPFGMEFENVPLDRVKLKARIFEEIMFFSARNNNNISK